MVAFIFYKNVTTLPQENSQYFMKYSFTQILIALFSLNFKRLPLPIYRQMPQLVSNCGNKITDLIASSNLNILEIGPGTGNLTSFILKKKPKQFIVIEKDNDLASNIAEIFKDQLKIINDDVLNIDENSLSIDKEFSSIFKTSSLIIFSWSLNISAIFDARSLSFSITINCLGFFFKMNDVKFPVPGPISKILRLEEAIKSVILFPQFDTN